MDALSCGWNVNMISAINKCLEIVDDPSKIIMDIITMYPNQVDVIKADNNYTSFSNYMRKRLIKSQTTLLSDITEFIRAHPTIQYRYLVQASKDPLPEYELLNFNVYNA
jgi:hypothetical protein